jgi:hypothetical protein
MSGALSPCFPDGAVLAEYHVEGELAMRKRLHPVVRAIIVIAVTFPVVYLFWTGLCLLNLGSLHDADSSSAQACHDLLSYKTTPGVPDDVWYSRASAERICGSSGVFGWTLVNPIAALAVIHFIAVFVAGVAWAVWTAIVSNSASAAHRAGPVLPA